jgi:hypothetical protein
MYVLSGRQNIRTINIAATDHQGIVTIYQKSSDGARVASSLHSIYKDINDGNFLLPKVKPLDVGCDMCLKEKNMRLTTIAIN